MKDEGALKKFVFGNAHSELHIEPSTLLNIATKCKGLGKFKVYGFTNSSVETLNSIYEMIQAVIQTKSALYCLDLD